MRCLSRVGIRRIGNLALLLALSACGGCHLYHNLGTGEHYDAPPEHPLTTKSTKVREVILVVTTDARGAVETVQFKRSSGSASVDQYIADSVRSNWPGGASTRSEVELTYSGLNGFTEPKLLSSGPAPANPGR